MSTVDFFEEDVESVFELETFQELLDEVEAQCGVFVLQQLRKKGVFVAEAKLILFLLALRFDDVEHLRFQLRCDIAVGSRFL